MNRRIAFGLLMPAIVTASIVAVFTGEREAVSLQIWLGVFVVAIVVAATRTMLETAAVAPTEPRSIFGRTSEVPELPTRDRRLRILEALILRSRDNGRSFSHQLQPELITLATHFLRVNHGADIERDPTSAQAVLGDLTWLIETPTATRTPTIAELERFVDLLTTPSRSGAE